MRMIMVLAVLGVSSVGIAEVNYRDLAEQAIREAAEKQAQESASWEKTARETAEKAAKETAEAAVKAAVEKAAKEAAEKAVEAAAKAAAEKYTDEKAEKEERKEERKRIETRIFKLANANATEVAEKLNTMWNGDFGVNWKINKMAIAFEESNSIMVTAPQIILDACEKSVTELDVEAQQVYIEARFVELGNNASHKIGIDWSGIAGGMKGTVGLGGGLNYRRVGDAVEGYTKRTDIGEFAREAYTIKGTDNGGDGSITYFDGTLDFSQMSLMLSALDSTQDAKTFSNPKIIVSSGKKAIVDMTTKYPNVQIAAKKTINNNNESVDLDMKMSAIPGEDKFMFAKEAFFSWGIELDVTPRISTNGLINVEIVPTISQLDTTQGEGGYVTAGTTSGTDDESTSYSSKYPIISMKRLVTEFTMQSGTTAVIGGLSRTEETQVDNGIPLLKDIPWIGPRLFGSMVREKVQKEIIVFVTVGLVNPRRIEPDAGLPKNAVLGRQYTKGQKLEPGDRPEKNMEGIESLDMRPLEEQAKDPLNKEQKSSFNMSKFIPFKKESYIKEETK